jgi:hypothetical protein
MVPIEESRKKFEGSDLPSTNPSTRKTDKKPNTIFQLKSRNQTDPGYLKLDAGCWMRAKIPSLAGIK